MNRNVQKTLTILIVISLASLLMFGGFKVKAQSTQGVVTIAFDDGQQSQYDNAYPLMQEYGFVGTYYVITGFLGTGSYMTVPELQTLQDSGNEIGSHSVDHPDFLTLTDEQINAECSESQQFLQSNGFPATDFAYPDGATNAHIDSIVSQYYRSARSAYTGPYVMSLPTSQFELPAYPGETGDSTLESQLGALLNAEAEVSQAASSGSWVIIFFHNIIPNDDTDPFTISTQNFASFLSYVQNSGVSVLTVNQALNIAGPSLSASISPTSINMNPGGSQQFTSTVTGGVSPYNYQWYLNGSPVTGATSPTWTFNPTSTGTYNIYLQTTDSYVDNAQSNTATAHVTPPLTATINPTQAQITQGQSQTFTSSVSGGATPYTYQWVLNGTAISGATSSTWKFTPTQTGHYNVYLNVTDNLNNKAQSNVVTNILVYSPLSVTINPTSANILLGGSQTFTSTFTGGVPPISYQWYLNGSAVSSANSATWKFTPISVGHYNIYVKATDSLNNNAQSNIVTGVLVYSPLSVSITPTSANIVLGGSQKFSSTVSGGVPPTSYQWVLNGTAVSGATGSTWIFTPAKTGHYTIYLNVTDNLDNKAQSNFVTGILVYNQMAVSISPTQMTLYYGQTQTFTANVKGGIAPYTSYQWFLNGTAVPGATNPTWAFTPTANGLYIIYLNVTDSLSNKVESNLANLNMRSIYLQLNAGIGQSTYSPQQAVTFTVDLFNGFNSSLQSTLTLTITGPNGYYFYDFQPINLTRGENGECTFDWTVPNVAGTYIVETGLTPTLLTAYDATWLQVSTANQSPTNTIKTSTTLSASLLGISLIGFCALPSTKTKYSGKRPENIREIDEI